MKQEFLKNNPEAVRGWKDALANPEEAARIQTQYLKALDPDIAVEELRILRRIVITPEVNERGFGTISRDKLKRTVDFIHQNIDLPDGRLSAEQIFADGYLPTTPIKP